MTDHPRSETIEVMGHKVWVTDYGPTVPGRWHAQFNDRELGDDTYWVFNSDTREGMIEVLEGHIKSVSDKIAREIMES